MRIMSSHEEHSIKESLRKLQGQLNTIEELERATLADVRRILHRLPSQPLTRSVAAIFTGDNIMATGALVFNVGQTSQLSLTPLLADGVTPSGGVLSGVSYTFSDPSATVVLNSDGVTATVTGVAASTGAIQGSAACTVTDTDGVVSTWTVLYTITTSAVAPPPTQLTQSVVGTFSTPVAASPAAIAAARSARPANK